MQGLNILSCFLPQMIINVRAKSSSSKEEIVKREENCFEIHVKEKAENNKANIAIIKSLAKYFNVPSSNVKILKGLSSRSKILSIEKT
jgi:uncharacterized protein